MADTLTLPPLLKVWRCEPALDLTDGSDRCEGTADVRQLLLKNAADEEEFGGRDRDDRQSSGAQGPGVREAIEFAPPNPIEMPFSTLGGR
jgi:hypothetical protein